MTGEVTLRGKVLPIGGLKEKLLAAHRAGIREAIMPKDNEKDYAELPQLIRDEMKLHFVAEMDEVLKLALEGALPKLEEEKPEALNSKMPPPSTLRPATEARQ